MFRLERMKGLVNYFGINAILKIYMYIEPSLLNKWFNSLIYIHITRK